LIKKHELIPQGEWSQRAEWFTRDPLELLSSMAAINTRGRRRLNHVTGPG
jgi:hypothetical protein